MQHISTTTCEDFQEGSIHSNNIGRNGNVFYFAPGSFFAEKKRKNVTQNKKKKKKKMEATGNHVT